MLFIILSVEQLIYRKTQIRFQKRIVLVWLVCTSWDAKLFLAIFVLIIVCIHITCLDSWIMHYSFFLQRPYILCSNAHNVLLGGATGSLNSKFKLSKFIANATKLGKFLADEHLRKKKNCTWAIPSRLDCIFLCICFLF